VLKLVLPWEDQAGEAAAALGGDDPLGAFWATVDFLEVECANVLASVTRSGTIDNAYAVQSLGVITDLTLLRWPATSVLESALELSCAHSISVYDACYVALAETLGVALLTADKKLVRALKGTRHAAISLGDFG
jgi:predicted nucleic acid-binding protein